MRFAFGMNPSLSPLDPPWRMQLIMVAEIYRMLVAWVFSKMGNCDFLILTWFSSSSETFVEWKKKVGVSCIATNLQAHLSNQLILIAVDFKTAWSRLRGPISKKTKTQGFCTEQPNPIMRSATSIPELPINSSVQAEGLPDYQIRPSQSCPCPCLDTSSTSVWAAGRTYPAVYPANLKECIEQIITVLYVTRCHQIQMNSRSHFFPHGLSISDETLHTSCPWTFSWPLPHNYLVLYSFPLSSFSQIISSADLTQKIETPHDPAVSECVDAPAKSSVELKNLRHANFNLMD